MKLLVAKTLFVGRKIGIPIDRILEVKEYDEPGHTSVRIVYGEQVVEHIIDMDIDDVIGAITGQGQETDQ